MVKSYIFAQLFKQIGFILFIIKGFITQQKIQKSKLS